MGENKKIGVWFRKDLRLSDHKALYYALKEAEETGAKMMAFFHIHPSLNDSFTIRHDYFFNTLENFADQAEEDGIPVHFIYGDQEEAFESLIDKASDLYAIYFNKDEVGFGKTRDEQVRSFLEEKDILVHSFVDAHIHGAEEVCKKGGGSYQVFTPYLRRWNSLDKPGIFSIDKSHLKKHGLDIREQFQEGYDQFSTLLNNCTMKWKHIGEKSAKQRLAYFLYNKVQAYEEKRDFPALNGTSLISPYLKCGVLSPRTVYHKAMDAKNEIGESEGLETYISEIAWRDFYNMIYALYPNSKDEEISDKYKKLSWNQDEELFQKWRNGETGFPIVDAAMKQLNTIGWMHNRLRMVVASFLTKDLLMDWRKGERYFEERLIDYDPSSNIGGWQWAASTGTDAVPYFRVFNPTRQSKRFDPEGTFIKTYLPALLDVPKRYIHDPSKMSEDEQRKYGCVIGEDYPEPVVDHQTMRKKAIAMFEGE
ncbi:deoxyribodipyrimidine photo-lyase [Pontibacillus sp. HMF3514]|uniref:cryptochrome/photolyase family protein n=1 Tax=Pontibacillus sp. HMF3514 TaxID=2692425 RepID=UPI00131F5215|nr:deoxyribodipyrimidine photo-lyase [Pontibacillus sp. HMF3514]QHE53924.1 deoxyribodipyrimidine photo-lyase [Pontibacillus sp. HMF3514]